MKALRSIILCSFCLVILNTCKNEEQKTKAIYSENLVNIDTLDIIHAILPVNIVVKGYLDFWKKETLLTNDTSQIISILVDPGQKVAENGHLLSLWQLYKSREYTPIDIRAPFPGIVQKIFVKIGSRVGNQNPLLHIYNDDYYLMKVQMREDQMRYIRKNQDAFKISGAKLSGFVESVDRLNSTANILLKNENIEPGDLELAEVEIVCGNIKGDYILSKYFKSGKNVLAYIDDESSFEIIEIGKTDSLSLISPQLPHLSKISVISHNN